MGNRRVGFLVALGTASVLTFSAVAGSPTPAAGTSFGNTARVHVQSQRSLANATFYGHVLRSMRVSPGWTGRVAGCRAGTISTTARRAVLDLVNSYRRLAGLRAVSFAGTLSARAQRAALMMEAAGSLSHTPARDWPCWTSSGAYAARRSNLALSYSGGLRSVPMYFNDPGSINRAVGHRRWILDPRQTRIGVGQTRHANALYVVDDPSWSWQSGAQPFTPWPPAGYFPVALEPHGRWSLSTARSGYDLRGARVVMYGPSGRLGLSTYRERGVVSWDLSARIGRQAARDRTYTVTVSGILRNGSAVSPLRYRVTLVPLRRPLTTVIPTVNGQKAVKARKGTVLTADRGSWSPSAEVRRYTFQWLRDGVPVTGATSVRYTVTGADAGRLMSVRIHAVPGNANYRWGTARSTDSRPQT